MTNAQLIHIDDHERREVVAVRPLVRRLAALSLAPGVVSAYVDATFADEQERERTRIFFRRHIREASADWPGLGVALQNAEETIERLVRQEVKPPDSLHKGMSLFVAPTADIDVRLWVVVPFERALNVAERPALAPLALALEETPAAIVAIVTGASARVYELALGSLTRIATLDSDTPSHHERGGWSQRGNQRHIASHRELHLNQVASLVTARFDEASAQFGRPPLIEIHARPPLFAELRTILPARVLAMSEEAFSVEQHATEAEVEARALELVRSRAERTALAGFAAAESAAASHGPGAVGVDAVVAAAQAQKLGRLYLGDGFTASGGRCRACGALWSSAAPACRSCGGAISGIDLREELAREAVLQDAPVMPVHVGIPTVAAALRY